MDQGYNDEANWSIDLFLVSIRALLKVWTGKSHLNYEESSTAIQAKQLSFN
jgi:hypothetical protein